MREIENLKKAILEEYPRLTEDDTFQFHCRPGVSCFNDCCGDVNIFLTPYDILRLKNRLNLTSGEFLARYTITPIDQNQNYPVILLKMQDDEKRSCFFVTTQGCSVYSDRPWACRYYPIGLASPKEGDAEIQQDFYFIMREEVCKGFAEKKSWSIREWKKDQDVEKFDEFGRLFKELTLHDFFKRGRHLDPPRMELFHMGCYNLDKFKTFITESTFFDRFEVAPELKEKILRDDEELLRFAFHWLKFALFGERTMKILPSAFK